jgi:hypothetical protein
VKQGEAHVMEEGRLRGRADLCSADGYAVGCHENKDGNRQAVPDGSWKVEGRHRALSRYVCSQGRRETHSLPLPLQQHDGYLHHHQRTRSAVCLQG